MWLAYMETGSDLVGRHAPHVSSNPVIRSDEDRDVLEDG
jgi:hypothetical protein